MNWVTALLIKVAFWMLPRLLGQIVNQVSLTLALVEAADHFPAPDLKRDYVLDRMGGRDVIPESVRRFLAEFCVILFRIGVTSTALDRMEELIRDQSLDTLTDGTKRDIAIQRFLSLFPDMPERVARLLVEIAMARVLGKGVA